MRKRIAASITVALLAAVVPLVVAGCGGDEGAERGGQGKEREYFFTFANVTEAGPLFVQLHKGVERAAEKTGIRVKFYNNDFNAEKALRNANLMVQDKPDLIFEYNAVAGVGESLGTIFERAQIPCIAVNVPNPGCDWFNLVNKDIGIDTAEAVGKIAKQKGWDGTNTVVILVQNATAGLEVNDCVRYFYVTLQEILPNMDKTTPEEIVPETTTIGKTGIQVDGKSALEPSFVAVKNVLQRIPRDKNIIVYTVNDDSTLGAWRAIEQDGRTDKALTAGLGGSEQGLTQLRDNPNWVAEGDIFFPLWGQYLLAMAVAKLNGADPPDVTTSPQAVLTKETINDYYRPGEFLAYRLPPLQKITDGPEGCPPRETAKSCGNDYLAETGVLQKFGNVQGLK